MITSSSLKTILKMVGTVLLQVLLFVLYIGGIWHSPLSLLLIFALPTFLCIAAYQRERQWINRACKVSGRIVDSRRKMVQASLTGVIIVEYMLFGMPRTHQTYRSFLAPLPSVGTPIELLYNPDKPDEVRESTGRWGIVLIWGILVFYSLTLVFMALYAFDTPAA